MHGGPSTLTIVMENGEEVWPCRCGHTHRGPNGVYDYGHHMCYHTDSPLEPLDEAVPSMLICPDCGQTFETAPS